MLHTDVRMDERNCSSLYPPASPTGGGGIITLLFLICSKLYWVDSKYKTLESVKVADNSGRNSVSLADIVGSGHVYGLAISGGYAYISCWKSNASIVKVPLSGGASTVFNFGLSTGAMFSNIYILASAQPTGLMISFVVLFLVILILHCIYLFCQNKVI